jgi:biotin operon repressor
MDFKTHSKQLSYLFEMIQKEQVSSPHQIGAKFNCSERTIRRMINTLREEGHDIRYCKRSEKYLLTKK